MIGKKKTIEETQKPKPSEIRVEKFCPACGAPVNPAKTRCEYCGSILPGMAARLQRQKELEHEEQMRLAKAEEKLKKFDEIKDVFLLILLVAFVLLFVKIVHH